MAGLIGKKIGMTQIFQEDGVVERVTAIQAGPCHVTGLRNAERDGYDAVQLSFDEVAEKRLSKPKNGLYKKTSTPPSPVTFRPSCTCLTFLRPLLVRP